MFRHYVLFFAVLFLIAFTACHHTGHARKVNPLYIHSEKAEIISAVLDSFLKSDTAYRISQTKHNDLIRNDTDILNSMEGNDLRIKEFKHQYDSLQADIDTSKLYVIIFDTLAQLRPFHLQREVMNNKHAFDKSNLDKWRTEITIIPKCEIFNMQDLEFKHNYEYLLRSKFKPITGHEIFAASIIMSPIYFNKIKNLAFVYFERAGSEGYDVFLEKRNKGWTVAKTERIWRY